MLIAPTNVVARALLVTCVVKPGDWTRGECGTSPVFASRDTGFRCGAPKATEGLPELSGEMNAKLEEWVAAKRQRDFQTSDRIRDDMKRDGVNPEDYRPPPGKRAEAGVPEFRTNFEGTRCFVENLSYDTDWRGLKDAFKMEGYPIVYASVSTYRDTGRSKGVGIVQFETVHAAEHAINEMTGYELDGRAINVRPDFQERRQRDDGGGGGGGGGRHEAAAPPGQPGDAWKHREWSRIAGSEDDASRVDDDEVRELLSKRDAARAERDYATADALLDQLADMGVFLDDARRQRVWWVGRRVDGREVRGRGSASSSSRGRRQWQSNRGDRDEWSGY